MYKSIAAMISISMLFAAPWATAEARQLKHEVIFDNPDVEPWRDGSRFFELDLEDEGYPDGNDRPNLNLVLIIDTSGSMAASGKLDQAKRTALEMMDALEEGDTFALVTFADKAGIILPSSPPDEYPKRRRAVLDLYPSGSTNLEDGLNRGYQEARRSYRSGAVNRLFLLTDGLANRGRTDPSYLSGLVAGEAEEGVLLSAFGVGLDYNEDLLASLADAGRGSYVHIAAADDIGDIIGREFQTVAGTAFMDVTVDINLNRPCRDIRIFGFPAERRGDRLRVHVGDLPSGSRRRIMGQLDFKGGAEGALALGRVDITYKRPGGEKFERLQAKLDLHASSDAARSPRINNGVVSRITAARADEEVARAVKMADQGRYGEAGAILQEAVRSLSKVSDKDKSINKRLEGIESYGDAMASSPAPESEAFRGAQKEMKSKMYRYQRSME